MALRRNSVKVVIFIVVIIGFMASLVAGNTSLDGCVGVGVVAFMDSRGITVKLVRIIATVPYGTAGTYSI